MSPKYAPANESGDKPYVVEYRDWRMQIRKVVYASDANSARYQARGRSRPGLGEGTVRRATTADLVDGEPSE